LRGFVLTKWSEKANLDSYTVLNRLEQLKARDTFSKYKKTIGNVEKFVNLGMPVLFEEVGNQIR